jgi:DNA-binding response OmpR family regulator
LSDTPARVFVLDDDTAITKLYDDVLRGAGYSVTEAHSVADAIRRYDEIEGKAQVLIVDLGLPDGDGGDFVKAAAAKYGSRPTLFVSGWTDEFWQLSDAPGRWLIMRKPIRMPKLVAAVQWLARGGEKPAELDDV